MTQVSNHRPKPAEGPKLQFKATALEVQPASAPAINNVLPTAPGVMKVKNGPNFATYRNEAPAVAVSTQKAVLSHGNIVPPQQPQGMLAKPPICHPQKHQFVVQKNGLKKTLKASRGVWTGQKQNTYQQYVKYQTKNGL